MWAIAALLLAVSVPFVAHRLKGEPGVASAAQLDLEGPGGMPVAVSVVKAEAERGALVPTSAVVSVEGKSMVFVVDGDLRMLVATPVELGDAANGGRRVLSGVAPGQLVVAEARAPLQRMLAQR